MNVQKIGCSSKVVSYGIINPNKTGDVKCIAHSSNKSKVVVLHHQAGLLNDLLGTFLIHKTISEALTNKYFIKCQLGQQL